jgi:transcriptional regulator with XRE-family HTH domain
MNEKLKAARLARGWTIPQFATYLQLHNDQTYRQWEDGITKPSEQNRRKLCEWLKKTEEELGF